MLTLLPGNYKSLICPKITVQIWWLYYLNDSLKKNDRIAHSGALGIANCSIIPGYKTTQKTKVGITPIPGYNSNFSYDIKRRT